jgi:hypothetical protein
LKCGIEAIEIPRAIESIVASGATVMLVINAESGSIVSWISWKIL